MSSSLRRQPDQCAIKPIIQTFNGDFGAARRYVARDSFFGTMLKDTHDPIVQEIIEQSRETMQAGIEAAKVGRAAAAACIACERCEGPNLNELGYLVCGMIEISEGQQSFRFNQDRP